jgi:tetratricopeptide (TPR) repeat protein
MAISYLLPFDLFQQVVYWLCISARSYRKGRSYLEKNQVLLQEGIDKELERLIIAHAEDRIETKQQIDHLALLRDIRTRTNTTDPICEAYVNIYGGFALDLPNWLEEIEKQITFLEKFHRPERTGRRQEQLLRYALDRINREANIAPEVCAELQNQAGSLLAQSSHYATQQERLRACETAIRYHEEALQVFTVERYPQQYARTCTYLGYAYQNYSSIQRTGDFQDRAIASYNEALQIYKPGYNAEQRASIQTALGKIYAQRMTGAAEENLTRAVTYHEAAMASLNRNKDLSPRTWATIQVNLGDTYLRYGNKDHGSYRELARACYRDALSIYTIDSNPKEWADIHVRLATIYQSRAEEHQRERDLLLRCAIVCSEAALLVYSPDSFPVEYAETLVSQGHLHTIRTEGNQIFNLEQACKCYRKALRIFTRQDFPEKCDLVLSNLSEADKRSASR